MPLHIIRQDITKMQVDAVVNTTNSEMVGYSGVDYAVHKAAGPLLEVECKKLSPLRLGKAKITKGYNLGCSYIIHTVGPVWKGGNFGESEILKSCYVESLNLAAEYNCSTVAFPLISSGAYGYPKDKVLKFAISTITEFLFEHEMTVYLCVYDRQSYEFSKKLFDEIREYIDDDKAESEMMLYPSAVYEEVEDDFCIDEAEDVEGIETRKGNRNRLFQTSFAPSSKSLMKGSLPNKTLKEYMKDMDKPFAYKLFDYIDEKGMTDVECYKKANVDKKTFSKIKCNPDKYKPSKQTAVAFAIALRLNLDETQDLLASAGMTLSKSFTFDKIILFFIQREVYDIFEINEALFEFDQMLLGV